MCLESLLRKHSAHNITHLPKFSIANGFMIGIFWMTYTTWVEKELCRLAQCQVEVKHLQGGSQRAIWSHGLTYARTFCPCQPAFSFSVTGQSKRFQNWVAVMKQHHCRKKEVQDDTGFQPVAKKLQVSRQSIRHGDSPGRLLTIARLC